MIFQPKLTDIKWINRERQREVDRDIFDNIDNVPFAVKFNQPFHIKSKMAIFWQSVLCPHRIPFMALLFLYFDANFRLWSTLHSQLDKLFSLFPFGSGIGSVHVHHEWYHHSKVINDIKSSIRYSNYEKWEFFLATFDVVNFSCCCCWWCCCCCLRNTEKFGYVHWITWFSVTV